MAIHDPTTPTSNPNALPVTPAGTSRRSLAGAFSALAVLACAPVLAVAAATSPDAELLDLCAEFHEFHEASNVPDEENWEEYLQLQREVTAEIEAIRPSTDAGRLAVAGIALVLLEETACEGNPHERFAISALRDLCGRA